MLMEVVADGDEVSDELSDTVEVSLWLAVHVVVMEAVTEGEAVDVKLMDPLTDTDGVDVELADTVAVAELGTLSVAGLLTADPAACVTVTTIVYTTPGSEDVGL